MSALNSGAAKNTDLPTHKGLGGRRSLSCSFVYLKGLKIFLGIRNFVSKMSDCIKFQKHVSFNYIIALKLDVFYFVYCKEYLRSTHISLNPVISITHLTIHKMMQFGTTTVKKRKKEIISTCSQVKQLFLNEVNNEHSLKFDVIMFCYKKILSYKTNPKLEANLEQSRRNYKKKCCAL